MDVKDVVPSYHVGARRSRGKAAMRARPIRG
jgi:hypothetical protein